MGYDIGYIHKNSIKKLSEDIPSYAKVIENPEMIEKDVIEKLNKYYNSNKFVSPFTDPNWVIIKDCIYYSAEGQLKIFDLKQSEFVSLFENKILFPDGYISDKFISYYRSKYSDYNLIVENDHLVALTNQNFAVEIQFGKAKRHKFFVSEEAADEYISEFEEKILDKILKD